MSEILIRKELRELRRKLESVKAERDALEKSVEMLAKSLGYAIWGEQEALQRVNALAVENAALKSKAAELVHEASEVYSAYNATIREPDGDFMDMQTLYEMQRIETPATSAALAAIRSDYMAEGAEIVARKAQVIYQERHKSGDFESAGKYLTTIKFANNIAADIREAK